MPMKYYQTKVHEYSSKRGPYKEHSLCQIIMGLNNAHPLTVPGLVSIEWLQKASHNILRLLRFIAKFTVVKHFW